MKHFIALLSLILISCANPSNPTGGPKDEAPPKLISSVPKNNTTNFKGNKIYFEFDERIACPQCKKHIYISPYTENFTTKIKNNILVLELLDTLLESTYQISIIEGIQDLTEKNKIQELKLSYSRTAVIDSLIIEGTAYDYWIGDKAQKGKVLLFDQQENRTNILNGESKPQYISVINEDGSFRFTNLPYKMFQVVGIDEEQENFILDKDNEKLAFSAALVKSGKPDDSLFSQLSINLLEYPKDELCSKVQRKSTELKIEYCNPIVNYKTQQLAGQPELSIIKGESSLRFYNTGQKDSFSLVVQAWDLLNNLKTDTINKVLESASDLKIYPNDDRYSIYIEPSQNFIKNQDSIYVYYPLPIIVSSFDTAKIKLISEDSTNLIADIKLDSAYNRLTLYAKNLVKHQRASLNISDSSVQFINRTYAGKAMKGFEIQKEDQTGSLSGRIVLTDTLQAQNECDYILFLMNTSTQEIEMKGIFNKPEFKFKGIRAGEKSLKLIIDDNKNGKWDRGSYQPDYIEAEKVIKLSKTINVKANWEIENIEIFVE